MDPNRLAALIEGQLPEHDRAELIATIGPAEAAGVLSDAMAALADVEEIPATNRARRHHWHPGVWLALAACVAGVLILPVAWLRMHRPSNVGPEQYAALLADQGVSMPPDWNDTPWDVTRGPEELTPEARTFRVGVRITDLHLAAQERSTTARRYAVEIAALLDQMPGAAPLAGAYRAAAGDSQLAGVTRVDTMEPAVIASAYGTRVRFGAWVEAARIAAAVSDFSFFTAPDSRAILNDPRWSAQLGAIRAEIGGRHGAIRDSALVHWADLEASLSNLAATEAGGSPTTPISR